MDEPDDEAISVPTVEAELNQLIGLFDAPAFARRGQDLEHGLSRIDDRCRRARAAMLDMVRVRLRQWAATATGPADWADAFAAPIDELWPLSGAEAPHWADEPAPPRRRRTVARELVASIERFNRRWSRFVHELNLAPVNRQVDRYNRYYVLEKECVLGSHRLAAHGFAPREPLTPETLLERHPLLPVPDRAPDQR